MKETMRLYWNFNGGVIRMPTSGYLTFVDTGFNTATVTYPNPLPTRATVYDGGITYDLSAFTNANGTAKTWKLGVPLKKATGKGLATISLPTDPAFYKEDYLGPARVHIVSSSGAGATAVVKFDGEARQAKSVYVTCPGWDYEAEGTTVAIESATNLNVRYSCAFTLADNAGTGGMTKRGKGVLVMNAEDDLTGPLTIESGAVDVSGLSAFSRTLRLTCAAAFGAETCLSSTESLDLTGSTIEIVDPENLPAYVRSRGRLISCDKGLVGVPNFSQKGWHLTCKGDSVSLAADRGMVLVLH